MAADSPPGKIGLLVALGLAAVIAAIVGSRFLWTNNPDFFRMEVYGLAYNFPVTLGDLCDPNPLAGLRGPMSNVTDQRNFSLIFQLPTKALAGRYDALTVHRFIMVLFFAGTVFSLVGIGAALGLNGALLALLVTYYGLSEQLLSYAFEYKLTLTSVGWLCALIWLFIAAENRRRRGRAAAPLVALFPLIAALGYETYCVSRPLAVTAWLSVAVWIAAAAPRRSERVKLAAIFGASSFFSLVVLRLFHPGIVFGPGLFEGRTESVVSMDGSLTAKLVSVVAERIGELPFLLDVPHHSLFISESPRESGWLEVWLLFLVLGIIFLELKARRLASPVEGELRREKWIWLFLGIAALTAVAIPLFSTTFVRGHRFFGLYLVSSIGAALLANALCSAGWKPLRWALNGLAVCIVSATLIHRLPLVAHWSPLSTASSANIRRLLDDLSKAPLPPGRVWEPRSTRIRLCDVENEAGWDHDWNAALYLSGLGCRLGASELRQIAGKCDCKTQRFVDKTVVCLNRELRDGTNVLSFYGAPVAVSPPADLLKN